ncbi:MAG: hypothetical protein AAF790_08325 [Planctomycetota bacterium]
MPANRTAAEVLEREYLLVRAKVLEIAASLDRIDRAGGEPADPARAAQLREGLRLLLADNPGRAEAAQALFSLPYDAGWRASFGLADPTHA